MSLLDTLSGTTSNTPTSPSEPPVVTTPEGTVKIVPYNANWDPQAWALLPYLWERMKKDDLVDYYFPGQKDTGFATFVRLMSGDANVALVTRDDPSKQWDKTITGFISWTTSSMGMSNVVIAGFNFFREFWDHKTTDAAGREAFKYWFTTMEPAAEVVLGVCPSAHVVALRYNKRIGLREVGRIPLAHLFKGERCDAILVAITRDQWHERVGQGS